MRKLGGDGVHRRADGEYDRRFGKGLLTGGNCFTLLCILIFGIGIGKALLQGIGSLFAEFTFWEGAGVVAAGLIVFLWGLTRG